MRKVLEYPLSTQHPLITQLINYLLGSAGDYFTQPTVQSPMANKQFPTAFQQNIQQVGQALSPSSSPIPTLPPKQTPTTQPVYPGQNAWVDMMMKKVPGENSQNLANMYRKAVTSPGFSGKYYGQPTATPNQSSIQNQSSMPIMQPQVLATSTSTRPLATGIQAAMDYIQSQTPGGKDPTQYYAVFKDPNFLSKVKQADTLRPGLSNVLLMQAFHESTLGNKSKNIFGILPGGEGSGKSATFNSPSEALDYQLSKNVMGGGANPNMNILSSNKQLTEDDLRKFYKSYNPEGSYIDNIVNVLRQ